MQFVKEFEQINKSGISDEVAKMTEKISTAKK